MAQHVPARGLAGLRVEEGLVIQLCTEASAANPDNSVIYTVVRRGDGRGICANAIHPFKGDGSEMSAKGKLSMGAHASDARTMAPTSARVIARGVVAPAAPRAH